VRFDQFEALTFDCYGTLIDWERGILDALRPWMGRRGLDVPDGQLLAAFAESEQRHEAVSPTELYPKILKMVFEDIAGRFGIAPEPEDGRAFGESVRDWPAFDDSPAALRYLERQYKLVVISNVDRASFAHSQARLGVEFDAAVTAEDVGSYKPDRRNFEHAFAVLKQLGVERDRILHVAQSLFHDHQPAKQLGLTTVWVNRRAGQQGWGATRAPDGDVRPDLIVNDLASLVAMHQAG
jgi:2-haloalkanoic acid dehalogenase type II